MNLIRPFVAHLPAPELAASVVSPPLGGLTTREWLRLADDNPHSFLHVMRTEVDTEEGGSDPYLHWTTGTARLEEMIATGVLRPSASPAFYVYAIEDGTRNAVGIVAKVHVEGYADGRIRRHEHTREATEELLLSHMVRVGAQSDPVALTHRSDGELGAIVGSILADRRPDLRFTGGDGALQQVWVVADDATVAALQARLDAVGPLYVTDGHHRLAATARYALRRSAADGAHSGQKDYDYVLAALYPETELTLREFNRCVRSEEISPEQVVAAIGRIAELAPVPLDQAQPRTHGEIGLVTGGRAYRFRLPAPGEEALPAQRLDVSRLQHIVLEPVFGIADPRTDHRLHYVAAGQPTEPDYHHCVACFLLYPTSVADVMRVADAGEVMPPKSTWFEPKVRSGLFVALLED